MTIESRDANNIILDTIFDVYSVKLTRSDGGGSEQYTATAFYQSAGLYKAELTPTVAGRYTMTVNIANDYTISNPSLSTEIIGSPFTITVDSDPEKNSIETFADTHIAGNLYEMTIQSRDANNNHLDSSFDVYTVEFTPSSG